MNIRERLEAFWRGEKPDRIPYTIYQWEWKDYRDDPAWLPMLENGLGITYHIPSVVERTKNVEYLNHSYTEGGKRFIRRTVKTPAGEIFSLESEGWCKKHMVETAEDYRVLLYITEDTEIVPCYEEFLAKEREIEPFGIPLVQLGRTPLQTILVDYVGLENFSYHLMDFEDEVLKLYDALLKNYRKKAELVAAGPGSFVSVLENFSAETLGPVRFDKYHLPVYKELFPVIQSSGKIIGTHYDGKLASCKELIAESPIDLIESLTEPPEGDMAMAECRKAWPDKLLWCNINVSAYDLPEKELQDNVCRLVQAGAHNGRKLGFEVSEHIPVNWKYSMSAVLEVLNDIRL